MNVSKFYLQTLWASHSFPMPMLLFLWITTFGSKLLEGLFCEGLYEQNQQFSILEGAVYDSEGKVFGQTSNAHHTLALPSNASAWTSTPARCATSPQRPAVHFPWSTHRVLRAQLWNFPRYSCPVQCLQELLLQTFMSCGQ